MVKSGGNKMEPVTKRQHTFLTINTNYYFTFVETFIKFANTF